MYDLLRLDKNLSPPPCLSLILDQRKEQFLRGVPLKSMVAYLDPPDLAATQKWWFDCTGESGVIFLLGCSLKIKPQT